MKGLTEKWYQGELTRKDLETWLKQQEESKTLDKDQTQHVTRMLWNIYMAYRHMHGLGHFLTALVENNLRNAVFRADGINIKLLPLYVRYLYHVAPADYDSRILNAKES